MTTISDLPGELTDAVIDFLQEDRATLRNCHFTCRSFRRRARFHLFRKIFLNNSNAKGFIQHCHDVPELPGLVRALRFWEIDYSPSNRKPDASFQAVLKELGSSCASITTLAIDKTFIDQDLATTISQYLPSLNNLRIVNCGFQSLHVLLNLLSHLPTLSSLKLNNLTLPHHSTFPVSVTNGESPFCPFLQTLSLSGSEVVAPVILKKLIAGGLAKQITKFRFPDIGFHDMVSVQLFIDAAGNGLQDIYLGCDDNVNSTAEGQ